MKHVETVFEWLPAASLRASVLAIAVLGIQFVLRLIKLQCASPSPALSLGFVGNFERGSEIKSRIRKTSSHRPGRAVSRVSGTAIASLVMVFGLTHCQSPDESIERENAPGEIQATPPAYSPEHFEELREAVREQEERVEDHRKKIALIVREKRIIYTGEHSFYRNPGIEGGLGVSDFHLTYNRLEQEKIQLESQLEAMLRYDSEQLMTYASGLNLPENIIKTLYPEYQALKFEIRQLKVAGLGDSHPDVVTQKANLDGLRSQMEDGIVGLRATLRARLDLANDRFARIEKMRDETRDEAIQRALDEQEYADAKKAFETEQALLHQMRLKLFGETITAEMPGSNVDTSKLGGEPAVTVVGNARRPGNVPFIDGLTLQQAIEAAGGPHEFGSVRRVRLFRDGEIREYDLRDPDRMPVMLRPHDVIEVPAKTTSPR